MKYQIIVAGEPSDCPNNHGPTNSMHIIKSRKPVEFGEPAERYRGQIKCAFTCYPSERGDCSNVDCHFGEIILAKRID